MSEVKRVVDYMKGLPSAAEHAKTYATEFVERLAVSPTDVISGADEEKRTISKGEKEIIGRLTCNAKFTRSGFVSDVKLGAVVSLGPNGRVKREAVCKTNFLGGGEWWLDHAASRALYSSKESTVHLLDDEQKRQIMSRCPTISGEDANDINMLSVHERLSIPTDLRHLMMKMYLTLCDYNLAVTSKLGEVAVVEGLGYRSMDNIAPVDRLAAITNHDIVVDTDNFTPEELGLLGLASAEYPSVWYAGTNIYTSCHMAADDLLFVSSGDIDIDRSLSWGSPDRLYHTMWSIAAKLDAVPSLVSALEMMRGKCQLVGNMLQHINGNVISSMIPLSYCQKCSLNSDNTKTIVTDMPGFLSTSVSLVSDLMYGDAFEAIASTVAESLGAIGTLVSSRTPRTNRVINGLMRDYGLQHTSAKDNILLRNWEIFSGRPITWEFGVYLKEYLLGLATNIINGLDIKMPQLLLTVPGLLAQNTAFGLSRGWRGPKHLLESSKIQVATDSDALCSIAWLVGDRDVRPQVFFNRSGKKPNLIGPREAYLQAEGEGNLQVGQVHFWITDTLGGRVDENEEVASDFFRTEFAGTRCAMVYDYNKEQWLEIISGPVKPVRETWRGEPPIEVRQPVTTLASDPEPVKRERLAGLNWGPLKQKDNTKILEGLKGISKSNSILPSHKPRFSRPDVDGSNRVAPYYVDGAPRTDLRDEYNSGLGVGDTIKVGTIMGPEAGVSAVHGVLEDLKAHGLVNSNDVAKGHSWFMKDEMVGKLSGEDGAAAIAAKWGMGLRVLETKTGTVSVVPANKGRHTITLVKDDEGKLSAGLLGDKDGEAVVITDISTREPGDPKEIEEFGNLFSEPLS